MQALSGGDVRFLVAGGLAVNAHGVLRFTMDVDLVIQLVPDNVKKAFEALEKINYRPTIPVTSEGFGDAQTREKWIREKGMRVLRFHSDDHWETPVDVFVEEPFVFNEEYEKAQVRTLAGGLTARVVSLDTLIEMKRKAGRPKDIGDLNDLALRKKAYGDKA